MNFARHSVNPAAIEHLFPFSSQLEQIKAYCDRSIFIRQSCQFLHVILIDIEVTAS